MSIETFLYPDWRVRRDRWVRMGKAGGWLDVFHFQVGRAVIQFVKGRKRNESNTLD